MPETDNFPYTEQDWEMIRKYGTSARFDWTYMLWRMNKMKKYKK